MSTFLKAVDLSMAVALTMVSGYNNAARRFKGKATFAQDPRQQNEFARMSIECRTIAAAFNEEATLLRQAKNEAKA